MFSCHMQLRRPDLLQMMLDAEAKNVVSDNSLEITPEGDDEVELIDKEEKSTLPKISRTLSYDVSTPWTRL